MIPRYLWKPGIFAAVGPNPKMPLRDPGSEGRGRAGARTGHPLLCGLASYAVHCEVRQEAFLLPSVTNVSQLPGLPRGEEQLWSPP